MAVSIASIFLTFAINPIFVENSDKIFAFSIVLFAMSMLAAFSFAIPATIALAAPPAPISRTLPVSYTHLTLPTILLV